MSKIFLVLLKLSILKPKSKAQLQMSFKGLS